MKRTLTYFLFTACLLFAARTAVHAATEKAIYCNSNKTLYFVYDDNTYNVSFTPYGQSTALTITAVYTGFKDQTYNGTTKSPWYSGSYKSSITTINFQPSFSNCKSTSYGYWFENLSNLTTLVNASNMNTSEATTLANLFYNCSKLADISGLANWDVSNVTSLGGLFYGCKSLANINALANWNVSNVTSISYLFCSCTSLVDISPLSGWHFSKPVNMGLTFYGMTNLTDISPLSGWGEIKVTYLKQTFHDVKNLTNISPLSNWDVSECTNMEYMFENCNLSDLSPLRNWNVEKVTQMRSMFEGNENIESLEPLKNWRVPKVTDMGRTFLGLSKITNLDALADWNPAALKYLDFTFSGCSSLTDIDGLANWHDKVGNVTSMSYTFIGCRSLENVDGLRNWAVGNVTSLLNTFYSCQNLTNIDALETWKDKVGKVTTVKGAFAGNVNLTNIDALKDWGLSDKLTDMDGTFYFCHNLKSADLSGWNTTNVIQMRQLFGNCVNMTKVKFGPGFSVANVIDAQVEVSTTPSNWSGCQNMFSGCHRLRYIDFHDCYNGTTANRAVPLQTNTGKKPTFDNMFGGCPATTVKYLPKYSGSIHTGKQNVVYSVVSNGIETKRCNNYYSEDKTIYGDFVVHSYNNIVSLNVDGNYPAETLYDEVELPYSFLTKKAEYSRTMPSGSKYGTAILPYDFTENSDTRCFVLVEEHPEKMYFVEATSIPAHTPFLYEKLNGSTTASFVVDHNSSINITVNATRDTSVPTPDSEHMPTGKTEADYGPYLGSHTIPATPKAGGTPIAENLVWQTKGYYETAVLEPDANTFYISQNKFWQAQNMTSADGKLTVYPHRATYHGNWEYAYTDPADPNSARSFSIFTLDSEDEGTVTRLIEAGRIVQAEHEATAIYDMQGRQQQHIVKGMNIIRTSDGKIKKVIKK